jgi:phosphatidylglycerol:prolipoprotein diacylglycerol transferase
VRPHVVHWLDAVLPASAASAVAPGWFTCVGLAGVVGLFWMIAIARRRGIDPGVVASVVLWGYLAAVTAGIVVPMAIDAVEQLLGHGRVHVRWSGMTSFWGYLGGAAAVTAVCRMHQLSLARLGDLAAAPLGAALTLARLGCFLGGCDYGKVSAAPWASRFPAGSPAWHDHVNAGLVAAGRSESLPVHPTQLYEAVLGLLLAGAACTAARQRWFRRRPGRTFLLVAAVYAVGRLVIEGFRGDAGRGIYLGLSSGQIFSVLVLAAIAGHGLVGRRRAASHRLGAATAAAVLVLVLAPAVHAQPRDPPPLGPGAAQPRDPYSQPPAPGAVQPRDPYGPPPAPGAVQPRDPYGQPPPPQPARPVSNRPRFGIGLLVGVAAPLNRRNDQVAMLAGPSLSLGLALRSFTLGLDLDSFGNTDASHGTVLLSAGMLGPVAPGFYIGGRAGLGATLVNFDDPAFRDVAGTTVRIEAIAEYDIAGAWSLWLRPLSFDLLTAQDLGGAILTWQFRVGAGYQFGGRRNRAPPTRPQ